MNDLPYSRKYWRELNLAVGHACMHDILTSWRWRALLGSQRICEQQTRLAYTYMHNVKHAMLTSLRWLLEVEGPALGL